MSLPASLLEALGLESDGQHGVTTIDLTKSFTIEVTDISRSPGALHDPSRRTLRVIPHGSDKRKMIIVMT